MSDAQQPDAQRVKKPYSEPKLVQIALKPEEAVLGYCKLNSNGPGHPTNCGPTLSPCTALGS